MPCKVTNQACCPGYSYILGGAGESTKIGSKKVRLVINDLNTLTAYQVYNEFNQKLNCKRNIVDLSAKQFVKLFLILIRNSDQLLFWKMKLSNHIML